MTLSLPDQKNPTNLFLEAVFPLLTNNSNADIVYVCVCVPPFAPHFAAKAKEKTPAAAAARRQRPGRAWAVQLFIFSAWEGVVLFSLSLLYIVVASRLQREREREMKSFQSNRCHVRRGKWG